MNIRIAREKKGWSKEILPYVVKAWENQIRNTLIVSPPGRGKTTLLRDLIRMLSNGVDDLGWCGRPGNSSQTSHPHRLEHLHSRTPSFPRWNRFGTGCDIPPSGAGAFAQVSPDRSSFQCHPETPTSSMRPQLSPQSSRSSLWIDTASCHLPPICAL